MTSSNVSRVRQYLQAITALGGPETIADFFAPDAVFHESRTAFSRKAVSVASPIWGPPTNRGAKSCSRKAIRCGGLLRMVMR